MDKEDREYLIRNRCRRKGYSTLYADYWIEHIVCEGCRQQPADLPPHHIKSRGAHGVIDEPWNLLSLCKVCTYKAGGVHGISGGNQTLAERYSHVAEKIRQADERLGEYKMRGSDF